MLLKQLEDLSRTGQSQESRMAGSPAHSSASSASSSSSSCKAHRMAALLSAVVNGEEAQASSSVDNFLPLDSTGSPNSSVTTRFVEEETLRSQKLLQRLDAHIQTMKQENASTVSEYLGKDCSPQIATEGLDLNLQRYVQISKCWKYVLPGSGPAVLRSKFRNPGY